MVVATALCRRVGGQRHQRLGRARAATEGRNQCDSLMVVVTALCRRVGGQRHQRLGQSEGGYSKIHLSILLPNISQINLDKVSVLN